MRQRACERCSAGSQIEDGSVEEIQRLNAQKLQKQQRFSQEFEAQLKAVKEEAEANGLEVVRSTLESLNPSQAKEQLKQMLDNDELDDVVILLTDMQTSRRAEILAQFQSPDESEQLAELLRRIRQGAPITTANLVGCT